MTKPSLKKQIRLNSSEFSEEVWQKLVEAQNNGRLIRLVVAALNDGNPPPTLAPVLAKPPSAISELIGAFREFGEAPPTPALLVKWQKLIGAADLAQLIRTLGIKGHLAKGHSYLAGAVLNEHKRRQAVQAKSVKAEQYKDGEALDTGWKWSSTLRTWVHPDQWQPAAT